MFLMLLQYELKQLFRSPMVWLLLVVISACIAFGAFNGYHQVQVKQSAANAILHKQIEKYETLKTQADSILRDLKQTNQWWIDPTHPLAIGEFRKGGLMLIASPPPVAILSIGLSDLQPEAELIKISGTQAHNSSDLENPLALTFGTFDLALVLTFLLPLFVIALSFNLISGERTLGTLPILLAQPVEPKRIFAQKMLARFSLLTALMLLVFWTALIALGVSLNDPGLWQSTALVVLYTFFWFAIALAINLANQSSAFNALACIGIWLLLVIIIPAMVNMAVEKVAPIQPRAAYLNALREADRNIKAKEDSILTAFYKTRPDLSRKPDEQKTDRDWWTEIFVMQDFEQGLKASIEQDYEQQVDAQASLAHALMGCSPALSFQYQLTQIAQSGRAAMKASRQTIEQQQKTWSRFFRKKYEAAEKVGPEDYDRILQMSPRMNPQEAPPVEKSGTFWLYLQALLAVLAVWLAARSNTHLGRFLAA